MEYRKINQEELNIELFNHFNRHQEVSKCWRKIDGQWRIEEAPFTDDWTKEDFLVLIDYLIRTLETQGTIFGAFYKGELKGFASIEAQVIGKHKEYLDLSSLHISEDLRGKGIGKQLFQMAKEWAKQQGAKKLYISAHSSVETQAFYKAMGCKEAVEYNQKHVEQEPFDCQLECLL